MADESQQERFLRGEDKPSRRPKAKTQMKRSRVNPVSEKQKEENVRWAAFREAIEYLCAPLICGLCDLPITSKQRWDLDHIVSRARGGPNTINNAQPVHRACHTQKHNAPGWSQGVGSGSKLPGVEGEGGLPGPSSSSPQTRSAS